MKDYYKLLGVSPSDSTEKIKEAYGKLKRLYSSTSLPLYSIYNEEKVKKIISEIEEAADILLHPEKRRGYNLTLLKQGFYSPEELNLSSKEEEEKDVGIEEGLSCGMFLRKVRELKGIDLKEVARVTKIQVSFLTALEEEKFEDLPARVFVRGFVMNYARFLKLKNVDEFVNNYMKNYDEWRKEKE